MRLFTLLLLACAGLAFADTGRRAGGGDFDPDIGVTPDATPLAQRRADATPDDDGDHPDDVDGSDVTHPPGPVLCVPL